MPHRATDPAPGTRRALPASDPGAHRASPRSGSLCTADAERRIRGGRVAVRGILPIAAAVASVALVLATPASVGARQTAPAAAAHSPAAAAPAAASPATGAPAGTTTAPRAASPRQGAPAGTAEAVRPLPADAPPPQAPATAPGGFKFQFVAGAGDLPLNVVTVGNPTRPPILFIHGVGQSYLSFERQLRSALAEDYYLVAFDLRGHGNSGKPWQKTAYTDTKLWGEDVRRIVEALELDRPLIVGWSYGTLVTMDYLRLAGADAVGGIVLTGAYGGLTPPPAALGTLPPALQRNRERQLSPDLEQNLEAARFTVPMLTAKKMPDEWVQRQVAIAMLLPGVARDGMFSRPFDNRALLPQLERVPLKLVIGGRDMSTPEQDGRALAKQLPAAEVSFYPESGHSPFVEDPERFTRELAAFAARVHRGRGP